MSKQRMNDDISTDLADGYELLRQSDIQAKKDFTKVMLKIGGVVVFLTFVLYLTML